MPNFYTKLFIDNIEVDLYKTEELPLNITKRVNSIEGKVQGDFSRASVTVPATKNNIAILGNTRAFKSFRIEVDGQPSFNGIARPRRIPTYSQSYGDIKEAYEINLVSNNSSWFALLGKSFLSEFTDLVVNYDQAEILAGFISDPAVRDYGFAPIKLKEWANSTGAGPTLLYQPSLYEMSPLLFVKPLIVAGFNSIGYTVESEFFDTDLGKKLAMSVILPEKMPQDYNNAYLNFDGKKVLLSITPLTASPFNFPFDIINEPPLNIGIWNAGTYEYTAPEAGYYEIETGATFGPEVGPFSFVYIQVITVNGVGAGPGLGGFGAGGLLVPFPFPTNETRRGSAIFKVNKGDIIRVETTVATDTNFTIHDSYLKIRGEATVSQGMTIDFKYLLSSYKFIDFLKGINSIANLTFETNQDTRVVTIEPKDLYLNQTRFPADTSELKEGFYTSTQKDYSQIIDKSKKGSEVYPNVSGEFVYKYASDSDETIDWIEGINDLGIYEARFGMSSGADTSKTKTVEVPFFVKTIHILDYLARYPDTTIAPQFLLIYPQNEVLDPTATEALTDITPRICYFAGQRGSTFGDGDLELYELPGVPTKNPAAFMVNYNDTSGLDPNLGFNNQIINGVESIGLLQKFYLHELARNNIGKLRNNYVKFNSIDFLNFTFRTKAYIDSVRYVVQDLKGYNPLKDAPTSFSFWEDTYPTQTDVDNIQNNELTGVVTTFTT